MDQCLILNNVFILCCLCIFVLATQKRNFRSVCVYTNLAQYKTGKGRFVPEHIETSLCTHIVYDFAVPEEVGIRALELTDESNEWRSGMYARINKLKERSPSLKVLLSVGGLSYDAGSFLKIAQNETSRKKFVRNAAKFLHVNNFDGINIAWNFVGQDGHQTFDKKNFQLLIEDFNKYFKVENALIRRLPLILSVMVPGRKEMIDKGLQVDKLANYIDFVNLYTFELTPRKPEYVDYNYPVYLMRKDKNIDNSELTIDRVAQYYVSLGMPKKKINIAIATFGRPYQLKYPSQHSVLSPAVEFGGGRNHILEDRVLGYYEVCDMIKQGATVWMEPEHDGVYIVQNKTWVGFESINTITKKACYTSLNQFGGLMFYSLDTDDFTGTSCNQGRYPLIAAAFKAMANASKANCSSFHIKKRVTPLNASQPYITSYVPFDYNGYKNPKATKARVVCYYSVPTLNSNNTGTLLPEQIKANMCTHISYNYGDVQDLEVTLLIMKNSLADPGDKMYTRVLNLKKVNPEMKILLAVKGSTVGSTSFLSHMKNDKARFNFAQNITWFLRKKNSDGIDIFWENTADRLNIPSDVLLFHLFVRDLRKAFDIESKNSKKPRLILSLALPASRESIESGFDVIKLTIWTDFISIKTFDFQGSWEKFVGFNSPLLPSPNENPHDSQSNVDAFVMYYLSKGGDVTGINIGIPTFAVTVTLARRKQLDLFSPASKPGRPGVVTATPGILAYYEVCELIQQGAQVVYGPSGLNRYLVSGDQWVGYDDKASVYRKVCYAQQRGIRGLMIYSLEYDDFSGVSCLQGRFPLLTTAYLTLLDGMCHGNNMLESAFASSGASRLFSGDTWFSWIFLPWGPGNFIAQVSSCLAVVIRLACK